MGRLEDTSRPRCVPCAVVALFLVSACMPPSGGGAGGGTVRCGPGDTLVCPCPGGAEGVRECGPDGWLTQCICGPDGGGGMRQDQGTVVIGEPVDAGGAVPPCTPACELVECGPDPVCGVLCGVCPEGESCNLADGQCSLNEAFFGFTGVMTVNEDVYRGSPGVVTLRFGGPVQRIEISSAALGGVLFGGRPDEDTQHTFNLTWEAVSQRVELDFDVEGRTEEFTARIESPSGLVDTVRFTLRWLCRGDDGGPAPACEGECAPNAAIGCRCANGVTRICDGSSTYQCDDGSRQDCAVLLGDDEEPGFCVEDLYVEGGAGCVGTVGARCKYTNDDGESFYLYCGANGRLDLSIACVSGACRAGVNVCPPLGAAECVGEDLIHSCLDGHSGRLPVGDSCQNESLGGARGRCQVDHCVQPAAGGFCGPPLVQCAGEMSCEFSDEGGDAGMCLEPASPEG